MNVLVIEDNLFDFCILEEMLKKPEDLALRLVHCYTLLEGFQALDHDAFDLILLDLNLPGSDGLNTFTTVYGRAGRIPIIVISAMDSAEVAVQAVKSGAQDYLVKGKINPDLLARAIRYALERKRLTEELRASEERYHIVSDLITDYAWSLSVGPGNHLALDWITGSFQKLTGFKIEDLPAKTDWKKLVNPNDLPMVMNHLRELQQGKPIGIEFRLKTQDGSYRWLRHHSRPILDEKTNRLVRIYGAGKDITERKEMESRLREADDRYHSIFDGVNDAILVESRTGRILDANLSACKLYGCSREELLAKHVSEIVPEEYVHVLAADTAELKAKVPLHTIEAINVRANGERFPVEISLSAYLIGDETVSLVVARDISQRKQAEEAYRTLMDRSLQELYIIQDDKIVFANQAAIRSAGYSLQELMAFTTEELRRAVILPEDNLTYEDRQTQLLSGESPSILQEAQVTSKDGQSRWVEALSIYIDYQGRPSIQTVQFDVTERKRVEERLHYRHAIEALITSVSTRFINLTSDRIESGIHQALQSLGKFVGADRAYIYLLSSDWVRFEDAYEWCAEGTERRAERMPGVVFEPFQWTLQKFKNREAVMISHPEELPEEAVAERELALNASIQSILSIPLVLNNMLFGFWGFETVRSSKAWKEEDVSLLRIMGDVFVNALARKQTDQVLRRARQELDQVVNSVSDALWTAEVDCETGEAEYRYISPVIERITGRPPEYFRKTEKPWLSIVQLEDREWVRESLDRTWKERGGLVVAEYRIQMPDGEMRWVRDSRNASEIAPGRVRLDAVLSDITGRKQAEEAYRLLVEQSLQELLIMQESKIVFANPAAVHQSGYTREELLGMSEDEVYRMVHPDDRDEVRRQSLARLAGQPAPERQEFRLTSKSGVVRWVESLSVRIEYQGKPSVQTAQIDITERKLTEERLRQRMEIEDMVTKLSAGFINLSTEEVDSHIQAAMKEIGLFTGVDLCYLDLISPDGRHILRSYEWLSKNSVPSADDYAGFDLEPFHWLMARQHRQEVVHIPRIADLPPEANFEKELWLSQGRRSVLNIPLILDDNLFGTLGFANEREEKEWVEEDIRLLQLMGDMFVSVLARKYAEMALIESEAQYRLLADSIKDVVSLHDMHGNFVYASPSIQLLSGKQFSDVIGKDVRDYVHPDDRMMLDVIDKRLLEVKDALVRLRICNGEGDYVWIESRLHLIEKDGKPFQILSTARDITESKQAEQALYEANVRLQGSVDEMKQRNQEVTLLNEMGDLLQGCLSLQDLYDVVGALAPRLFPNESGALYVQNASKKLVEANAVWGESLGSETMFAPEKCWALRRGRIHSVNMPEHDLNCGHITDKGSIGYVCIPMSAHGELLGLFYLKSDPLEEDEPRCKALAIMVAERVALAIANLRLRESLQHQSIRDSLTGLFNRRYMETTVERELRQAQRQNQSVGFIMMDLDHFKMFNDSYGHGAGDALLASLGEYLSNSIRGSDIACRYGGDEFALILPQASLADTAQRAEYLREGLKRVTINYKGTALGPVTASIGVSAYPDHAIAMDPLFSLADMALYRAKDDGRDRVNIAPKRTWEERE